MSNTEEFQTQHQNTPAPVKSRHQFESEHGTVITLENRYGSIEYVAAFGDYTDRGTLSPREARAAKAHGNPAEWLYDTLV